MSCISRIVYVIFLSKTNPGNEASGRNGVNVMKNGVNEKVLFKDKDIQQSPKTKHPTGFEGL
jgi:hypothetical protein